MKLSVELVPSTCWYTNVRSNVTAAQWEVCKRYVRTRSGNACEICGGRGRKWPVECHEIWAYDDEAKIQTLVDLIALCPACHECKHIGRAEAVGRLEQAAQHLMRVNGWTEQATVDHIMEQNRLWQWRSQYQWSLELSFLGLLGLPTSVKDRAPSPSSAHLE